MAMGRPRGFDPDAVVDAAVKVFWRKGYEGASMADLCAATGLRPGSVYAAYGSKLGLFSAAVDRYVDTVFAYGMSALRAPTAAEVVRMWLRGSVDAATGDMTPPGCLLVQGALATGEAAAEAQEVLTAKRLAGERVLALRLAEAKVAGDLPADADPEAIARYVLTVASGIAVQAASGVGRAELLAVADVAAAHLVSPR
ncbi:TetR/AcrR family transcriptional regulator [Dactylosporangium aurantiacum]|uniref:TetR/AcrR family transcriptional regulator n=1 Tax=Dactylosporangium aurantiacum TaxID=35754 RepID=A0A9Q9MFQ1_9ACTN|nr:TetR/AcrR family transcriptional regulator [Dactylosporangium aurantiacum]MDG6107794.1 TetR/AcrR family transcriptional regulator [Dactylosporangium aurantiacum]UWZ57428.1 TetR/AcrR family transcriptional regulator [Dactylosporangium aurantiacum]